MPLQVERLSVSVAGRRDLVISSAAALIARACDATVQISAFPKLKLTILRPVGKTPSRASCGYR